MSETEKRKQLAELAALDRKLDAVTEDMNRLREEHPELFENIETAFKNVYGRSAESAEQLLDFAQEENRDMVTGKEIAH
jgi:hypothetical protein